jgi:hypothetical protein
VIGELEGRMGVGVRENTQGEKRDGERWREMRGRKEREGKAWV